jgi:hypothetical protein
MAARTAPTIALGPNGNQRGSHYFLFLRHGRVLRRTRWDELPMPQDVIDRVSAIGYLQGMPQTLTFADAYGRELSDTDFDVDDEHDNNYVYEPADDISLEYDSVDDLPDPDVDDSDLPALTVAARDDEMEEDDNHDDDVGEDNIVVSDMDSIDSSDFSIQYWMKRTSMMTKKQWMAKKQEWMSMRRLSMMTEMARVHADAINE